MNLFQLPKSSLYIGLMSGTSLDAVDAVLVDFKDSTPKLIESHAITLNDTLGQRIAKLNCTGSVEHELHESLLLNEELAYFFAQAVNELLAKTPYKAVDIAAIGSHGQTLRHSPQQGFNTGFSHQVGDPAIIAEQTGITCCADFRSRDIAAGGQGAPLVPAFHAAFLSSADKTRAVVNIGGMANITYLPKLGGKDQVLGFDSGPGNVLMNSWMQSQQGKSFDENGAWAKSGQVNSDLLTTMLAHPYFAKSLPKSTGRETFDKHFIQQALASDSAFAQEKPENIQATLLQLTAQSIADALPAGVDEIIVCGGGTHNKVLLEALAKRSALAIQLSNDVGIDADNLEAIAFAWLAKCLLHHEPANMPAVTGAKGGRLLGGVYPA